MKTRGTPGTHSGEWGELVTIRHQLRGKRLVNSGVLGVDFQGITRRNSFLAQHCRPSRSSGSEAMPFSIQLRAIIAEPIATLSLAALGPRNISAARAQIVVIVVIHAVYGWLFHFID
ncbi:MAG: hypothetical protein ACRD2H_10205 [Terriglobales bacterium]